ncbi:MAG: ABC transporter ATP-binding protein [Coriobacteriia bacterium]|nr:ABC transporter ATP-binding protein [Coriobacteriia bacterium]
MAAELLSVNELKVHFHTRDGVVKAVDGVTYSLASGETLGVVGESGSGKSVHALAMMGLVPMPPGKIEGGDVSLSGRSLIRMSENERRGVCGNEIAMVFQDPMTSLNPVHRIGHQLAEPLRIHKGMGRRDAWARAGELLQMVGIPNPESRLNGYPHQFSGGMRQRVMIAMAIACDPGIVIADEPTTALDATIQAQVLELMRGIQKRSGLAIIMITHDLGVIADMADRVLVMYAGRAVELGSADQLFRDARHPYTWGLIDSLPRYDTTEQGGLRPIGGQPPSLINLPEGCSFGPRCRYTQDICRTSAPALMEVEDGHRAACHFACDAGLRDLSPRKHA